MSFLKLFRIVDINQGVAEYRATSGAVLLDVRTAGEYRAGRIPGSRNVPLDDLDKIAGIVNA